VYENGRLLTLGVDYTINDFNTVNLVAAPDVDTLISIQRINTQYVSGNAVTTNFNVGQYFFMANNIYSVNVFINNVLQRPNIDYTWSGSSTVVFTTAPASGTDNIQFVAQSYFRYVSTLTVGGLNADARFGQSLSVSTDGQQVVVGTPNATVSGTITSISSVGIATSGTLSFTEVAVTSTSGTGRNATFNVTCSNNSYTVEISNIGHGYTVADTITILGSKLGGIDGVNNLTITVTQVTSKTEAGAIYVFDRDVQRFIYGQDPSSVTFTVLGTVTTPVSVTVNDEFLINQTDAVINAPNSFVVSGNNVTVLTNLIVGDVVEVQTNQFTLFQTVYEDFVSEFSNFGTAVDLCKYNCSLYGGAPQSSAQIFKGGVVERSVNVARIYGSITATITNPSLSAGDTLRVNNTDVAIPLSPDNTVTGLADAINAPVESGGVPNVVASVDADGYLTIAVKNSNSAPVGNKLSVKPGSVGTVWTSCGLHLLCLRNKFRIRIHWIWLRLDKV
jgi:hypothetical protein